MDSFTQESNTWQDQASPDIESLFSATFYQASVGMVIVRLADGRFVKVNPKICDMLGFTEAEFCQLTIADVTHPDDLEADLSHSGKMMRAEVDLFAMEKRLIRKNGEIQWVRLTAVSVSRDPQGQPTYGMAVCEDIGPLKQAQSALKESEARFATLADTAPVGIFVLDTENRIQHVNREWMALVDQDFPTLINEQWKAVIHPEDLPAFGAALEAACSAKENFRQEVRTTRSDDAWILIVARPRYLFEAQFAGYIGTAVDITEQKRFALALEQSKVSAEEASQKKSEFLSFISHELRTPLNAIIGFSEMLELGMADPLTPKQQEMIGHVSASGRHLLSLINDLLDMSRIEAGKMSLRPAWVSPQDLLDEVRVMVSEQAEQKNLMLSCEAGPDLSRIWVDPLRFRQILLNLVHNAIRFNVAGGSVIVSLRPDEVDGWLLGEVRDTGIGMAADCLSALFQKFYQASEDESAVAQGSGLGLALTRELIAMQGGTISVFSDPGQGSTFTFRLPVMDGSDPVEA